MNRTNGKPYKLNRKLLSCALLSCLAMASGSVLAQSTSAILRGQVTEESAAAAGASVTATNTQTGLARTVKTTATGFYSLAGLPPGTYRIDVEANGKRSSRTVNLQVGQAATLNLGVGGMPETATTGVTSTLDTVTVVGQNLAETRTSEVATYVTQRQIELLPQNSRNFLAFAETVPGMQLVTTGNGNETQLRSGAQGSSQINVFIDGVGQKNYVTPGGITGQEDSRGNPFPQLAIGEYKVITSNYKAEYDQISSAAVSAVTKSGTNEFEGSFFWDRFSETWREPSPTEEERGIKDQEKTEQYGFSWGGPIIRDKLHFFMTYEAKDFVVPATVEPPDQVDPATLPVEISSNFFGLNSRPFNQDTYFGKLSWQASDDHLIEFTARIRDEQGILDVGGVKAPSSATVLVNDETRYDLRSQYSAENWLNDAHITFEEASYNPRPLTPEPSRRYTVVDPNDPGNLTLTVLEIGGGTNFQDKGQKGWSFQDDFTWFGFEGHTLKAGIKYKELDLSAFQQIPPFPLHQYDVNESMTQPYRIEYTTARIGRDPFVESKNKQFGLYIQDDWQVTDKLMLNLGVRWDYEKIDSYTDYVLNPDTAAALRGWTNIQNTDYDIEDYISNGNNRKSDKDNIAPRLGFSYDLFSDQRHVIFGGAGRSYDRNLFDYMARERYAGAFTTYVINFNTPIHQCAPGPNCIPFDPALLTPEGLAAYAAANPTAGGEVNLLNNELETPYSDQFSLGMRNLVTLWGSDWSTSATVSHIRSKEGIYFRLGNRFPDGSFRDPAVPGATWGNQPWGQAIPGYGSLILADNGIETKLNSLLLSAEKQYTDESPWAVTLAYTYSDAEENRVNSSQNNETSVFDYPYVGDTFYTSTGVPKHQLVATGIVGLPWDFTLSGKLKLTSQRPREAINCLDVPSTNNCFFDPYEPDGTIGYKQFDLAVQREWTMTEDMNFYVRVDVLNVFNWRNWTDYNDFRGNPGDPNPTFGELSGNGIYWPTRTFKLSIGYNW